MTPAPSTLPALGRSHRGTMGRLIKYATVHSPIYNSLGMNNLLANAQYTMVMSVVLQFVDLE